MKTTNHKQLKGFCVLPFIHLSTRTDGSMQICCHANSSSDPKNRRPGTNRKDTGEFVNLKVDKAEDYWNTDFMRTIRTDMLANKKPRACLTCYKEESLGYRSKRVWENEEWENRINVGDLLNKVSSDGSIKYGINYVDMKLGNKCDLACVMCNPADSTQWIPDYNKLISAGSDELKNEIHWNKSEAGGYNWWKNNKTYWNDIYEQLHNLKHIYIIGGEPTINKEFKVFLQYCVDNNYAKDIELRFNTNGQTLDNELKELYKSFKHCLVHLSMDGIEQRYTYIRYPGTWEKELNVLKYWDDMPDNVTVDIDCTVSALNVSHIPEFVRWKMDQGFKKLNKRRFGGTIGMHFLWTPNFLGINNLNKEIKQKAQQDIMQLRLELGKQVTDRYKKFDALISALDKPAKNIPLLVEYLDKMDRIRGTSWTDTFPELISLRQN
jgi:molybdenum cofactor biosynthesis enzyme MoaA